MLSLSRYFFCYQGKTLNSRQRDVTSRATRPTFIHGGGGRIVRRRVAARRSCAAKVVVAAAAAYRSLGPPARILQQLVRVVRTGKMAGPRVTRCFAMYCVAAFAAAATTASRADGVVYEKIPLGECILLLTRYRPRNRGNARGHRFVPRSRIIFARLVARDGSGTG